MNLKVILITIFLLGGGLSWPLKVNAEQPTLDSTENTETISSLPWQLFSSTSGQYVVDLPGMPEEQTGTSTLLDRQLRWHMNAITLPAVDEADLFEYYLVAHIDIPWGLRYEHSPEEVLDAATTIIVNDIQDEQLNATLEIEEIAFRGVPGRLMTGQGLGQYVAMTLSTTGNRLYLLLAIDDDLANFDYFFNSFSLVP